MVLEKYIKISLKFSRYMQQQDNSIEAVSLFRQTDYCLISNLIPCLLLFVHIFLGSIELSSERKKQFDHCLAIRYQLKY